MQALDVFRGMTIAGMVLVNSPGSEHAYGLLRHAAWHGWTAADLVFPSFLVITGISMAISLARRAADGSKVMHQVSKRAGILFGLGLLINAFTPIASGQFRILGVLQRIALCNWFGSALSLGVGWPAVAAVTVALLAGHWALLTFVPVPGFGPGQLTPEASLSSWLDRAVLGGHVDGTAGLFDDEGLLGTVSALATSLIGVLAGRWLLSGKDERVKLWGLLAAGLVLTAAGLLWDPWFPINKKLWTGSFALFTGGAALAGLASTAWLGKLRGSALWTKPFEVFGRNPLVAYFLSGALYQLQNAIPMTLADGSAGNLRQWLVGTLFSGWLSPANAALAFSLSYVLAFLGLMAILHRKKIFIKL